MKIDWLKYKDDHVLGWCLLHSMSETGGHNLKEFEPFNSHELEVVLTVNGVEVPFVECMETLQKHLNSMGKEHFAKGEDAAKNSAFCNLVDRLQEIVDSDTNFPESEY